MLTWGPRDPCWVGVGSKLDRRRQAVAKLNGRATTAPSAQMKTRRSLLRGSILVTDSHPGPLSSLLSELPYPHRSAGQAEYPADSSSFSHAPIVLAPRRPTAWSPEAAPTSPRLRSTMLRRAPVFAARSAGWGGSSRSTSGPRPQGGTRGPGRPPGGRVPELPGRLSNWSCVIRRRLEEWSDSESATAILERS